jgi:RES domain-containing protein
MIDKSVLSLWRISDYPDLNGAGGFKRSGRWHNRGRRVVYLADSPSGALLERLVHLELDQEDIPDFYTRLKVAVPDNIPIEQLDPPEGLDWTLDEKLTRGMADAWLASGKTCIARVPSAIASEAWNYLLNPMHPDAKSVVIEKVIRERFDPRLFKVVR